MAKSGTLFESKNPEIATVDFADIAKKENQAILSSLAKHGICSLQNIPITDAIANPVMQMKGGDATSCVNYVNLTKATSKEFKDVINTLLYEEYLGVYGILLERFFTFRKGITKEEIAERLLSGVVFILNPPSKRISIDPIHAGRIKLGTEVGFYPGDDSEAGFNQSHGGLLTSSDPVTTNRTVEISTVFKFKLRDSVQAIMVPEPMMPIAKEIFSEFKVDLLSVPMGKIILRKLPDELLHMHGEKLSAPTSVEAPLYERTLTQYIQSKNLEKFSMHAVRMHTSFDFVLRPLVNSHSGSVKRLIKHVKGQIISETKEGDACVVIHKRFALSRQPLLDHLEPSFQSKLYLFAKIVEANKDSQILFEKLKKAGGELKLVTVSKLTPSKIAYLRNVCKAFIQLDKDSYVIAYHERNKALIERVLQKFKSCQHAAITMQSMFRGRQVRRAVIKEAEEAVAKAKLQFEQATKNFNVLERLSHKR